MTARLNCDTTSRRPHSKTKETLKNNKETIAFYVCGNERDHALIFMTNFTLVK